MSTPGAETGDYGLSERNPVTVGGALGFRGAANEHAYLDQLSGPAGQTVTYRRLGNCCPFDTPNSHILEGLSLGGLLDRYEVTYEGLETPVVIYINMYDRGPVEAPPGFKLH